MSDFPAHRTPLGTISRSATPRPKGIPARPRVLLLDCSPKVQEAARELGYEVQVGSTGICNGIRKIPRQIYEHEVFIFDPRSFHAGLREGGTFSNSTPDHDLARLEQHLHRHITVLVLLNDISPSTSDMSTAYRAWIPHCPVIHRTADVDAHLNFHEKDAFAFQSVLPMLDLSKLKRPVRWKLNPHPWGFPLLYNSNNEPLGIFYQVQNFGRVFILPETTDNDEAIRIFLARVIPRLHDRAQPSTDFEYISSPIEAKIEMDIAQLKKSADAIAEEMSALESELLKQGRLRLELIKTDSVAKLLLEFHSRAILHPADLSLHIYKILDTLKKNYGGEKLAKAALGGRAEWNLIKRLCNDATIDARHGPDRGVAPRAMTDQERIECLSAGKALVGLYISRLVGHPAPPNEGPDDEPEAV